MLKRHMEDEDQLSVAMQVGSLILLLGLRVGAADTLLKVRCIGCFHHGQGMKGMERGKEEAGRGVMEEGGDTYHDQLRAGMHQVSMSQKTMRGKEGKQNQVGAEQRGII